MVKRRGQSGLTLLEILLALIILVLGVLGILALFPPALQSANESMEDTNAAMLAESVAHALTNSMKYAYDPSGGANTGATDWQITFCHDLQAGSTRGVYTFVLPKIADDWKHFPSSVPPPQNDPGAAKIPYPSLEQSTLLFKLGGDDWVRATTEQVKQINDPTDSYDQFAFSFDMKKINFLEYLLQENNPATGNPYQVDEIEGMSELYEVRIHVFRVSVQGAIGGTGSGGQDVRKLVATFTKRITL